MDQALAYLDARAACADRGEGRRLAQGKRVVVANTREDAKQAVRDAMEKSVFGQAGQSGC